MNLVLYAGHGEFPRVVYAPGNLCEAYELTARAFNVADKYQIPVFVLTDQYFLDSFYNVETMPEVKIERYVVKTDENYRRYEITESGISPRGIPGYGSGLVRVDSDEHDEYGHITESAQVRKRMVEKRLRKFEHMLEDSVPPKLFGPQNYEYLLVAWGSTQLVLKESVELLNDGFDLNIALLHFSQVYPVHPSITDFVEKARKTIFVEGNATGQFANLVKLVFGIHTNERILKYDGFPFSVEEAVERILGVVGRLRREDE